MITVEVEFPRTPEGPRVERCTFSRVPCEGEGITTTGDDHWTVSTVTHVADPGLRKVVALVRVR